jgi:cell wall-associated NlpC family hydrolase
MTKPDPRLHPYKDDLAAEKLRGKVDASLFVKAETHCVIKHSALLHKNPDPHSMMVSEALFAERFDVYDTQGDWCWGQLQTDDYVGWCHAGNLQTLTKDTPQPTHRIKTPRTHLYPYPDIKAPPLCALPMGAQLTLGSETQGKGTSRQFAEVTETGFAQNKTGYILAHHATPLAHKTEDWVAVAESFLHSPYLWGGRTAEGLDCSALVQLSLQAAGIASPRDSDMQEKALGTEIDISAQLERGDLVFWKGHVGIMLDDKKILHANAYAMAVSIDTLSHLIERLGSKENMPVTSVKRLL